MKKKQLLPGLALIGALLFSSQIDAQITITSADMPVVGDKFVQGFDTTSTSTSKLTPGGSGASVTWNYAALPVTYRDTNGFVNPTATPYGAAFPSATLADTVYGTVGYTYLDLTSSIFSAVGIVQQLYGYTAGAAFNPPFRQLKLPAHYGDTMSGTSIGKVSPFKIIYTGFDSAKGTLQVSYIDSIDAYGTITTPFNTFPVLRKKHYELDIDSVFLHSTTNKMWDFFQAQKTKVYEYMWYGNGIGSIVALMKMDTANKKVVSMEWYYGIPNGINELSEQQHSLIYPNPCTNQINFTYSKQNARYIDVFDITGRELGHPEIKNGVAILNTSGYSPGMYFYHITDDSGNVIDNGKFSVIR